LLKSQQAQTPINTQYTGQVQQPVNYPPANNVNNNNNNQNNNNNVNNNNNNQNNNTGNNNNNNSSNNNIQGTNNNLHTNTNGQMTQLGKGGEYVDYNGRTIPREMAKQMAEYNASAAASGRQTIKDADEYGRLMDINAAGMKENVDASNAAQQKGLDIKQAESEKQFAADQVGIDKQNAASQENIANSVTNSLKDQIGSGQQTSADAAAYGKQSDADAAAMKTTVDAQNAKLAQQNLDKANAGQTAAQQQKSGVSDPGYANWSLAQKLAVANAAKDPNFNWYRMSGSQKKALLNVPTPQPVTAARGGYISGPGTSRSDSIPARLSDGEYVIPADVVKKIGKPSFDKLLAALHDYK
jgi:hypothetical protein